MKGGGSRNSKWLIYIVLLIQGALHRLCIKFTHSHTHSYTDGGGKGNHARHQPAHREQLGVLLKDSWTLTLGEPGIELGTFQESSTFKDGFSSSIEILKTSYVKIEKRTIK